MTISILNIFDLSPPLETGAIDNFTIFYIEAERLITLAQNRGDDILSLYDIIISTIDASLLSNSKGTKTWLTQSYEIGQKKTTSNNESQSY